LLKLTFFIKNQGFTDNFKRSPVFSLFVRFSPIANKTLFELFDFLYFKEGLPFEIGGGNGFASIP